MTQVMDNAATTSAGNRFPDMFFPPYELSHA
jgi:hypothetical protein